MNEVGPVSGRVWPVPEVWELTAIRTVGLSGLHHRDMGYGVSSKCNTMLIKSLSHGAGDMPTIGGQPETCERMKERAAPLEGTRNDVIDKGLWQGLVRTSVPPPGRPQRPGAS